MSIYIRMIYGPWSNFLQLEKHMKSFISNIFITLNKSHVSFITPNQVSCPYSSLCVVTLGAQERLMLIVFQGAPPEPGWVNLGG